MTIPNISMTLRGSIKGVQTTKRKPAPNGYTPASGGDLLLTLNIPRPQLPEFPSMTYHYDSMPKATSFRSHSEIGSASDKRLESQINILEGVADPGEVAAGSTKKQAATHEKLEEQHVLAGKLLNVIKNHMAERVTWQAAVEASQHEIADWVRIASISLFLDGEEVEVQLSPNNDALRQMLPGFGVLESPADIPELAPTLLTEGKAAG